MTEERNTAESAAETDAHVTRAYREVADERAPKHLNRAVLEEAASAARPRYSRLRSWTRPMAWAATVMLSVALVLEATKVPAPEGIGFEDAAGKFEVETPELDAIDDAPAEVPQAEAVEEAPATGSGRSLNATSMPPPDEVEPANAAAEQLAPDPAPHKKQRSEPRQNTVDERDLAAPAAKVGEFRPKDGDMLRQADDMARMQSGENGESALQSNAAEAADAAAPGAAALSMEARACDESATATPETWLECIAELEEAGLTSEARQQRELLQAAFPEFNPR